MHFAHFWLRLVCSAEYFPQHHSLFVIVIVDWWIGEVDDDGVVIQKCMPKSENWKRLFKMPFSSQKYQTNAIPYMRRCQIRVQFESGARTKFLATLFQPMTSMSDYQSVPWSHSFQNMYNTHMCKMHLIAEKWGFSKKIYLNFMKNCKVLLEYFTLGHFISTFMNTNHKVSYMNGFVLT